MVTALLSSHLAGKMALPSYHLKECLVFHTHDEMVTKINCHSDFDMYCTLLYIIAYLLSVMWFISYIITLTRET